MSNTHTISFRLNGKAVDVTVPARELLIHTLREFLTTTAIAGIPGVAVVSGVAALYAWLVFVMLRYQLDEDELGPGQVHV